MVAHGKMPADEIDDAMVRFADGDGDVLLATNIIESGLDVPRANTMLVWRADRFGLAQLHQLRGRVGRGRAARHRLPADRPGPAARARHRASGWRPWRRSTGSGAGFAISARDLDLRGAGDLLGEEQAGHVKLIGLGLYQHLLERALRAARGEAVEDWTPGAEPRPRRPDPGGLRARAGGAHQPLRAARARRRRRATSTPCGMRSRIASDRCPRPSIT